MKDRHNMVYDRQELSEARQGRTNMGASQRDVLLEEAKTYISPGPGGIEMHIVPTSWSLA